ncbi:hemerythrin domain-containing protein [Mycolicibacterium sp. 141076]|uniref:hemerythrin domain-containing protein n=1 Tax=Mycolicibacterium sp. 141076 TaxID=3090599 RepID=UPI00299E5D90|nr:hemerythrin domain-containing protein [Mycolicibacterium sp. 141076]MDX1877118.1 hemerythrin domain-containing protein [Mycolicibacterium sp. 141076]
MASHALKSPSDVIDLLTDQHEQIKSLFTETLVLAGDERARSFRDLRRLLAVHETAEEEIVHPRAKQKLPGGEKVVDARLEEEHEAKKLLSELESLDIDSKEFTAKLTKLRDAVIAHAEHEEAEEFAKLGTELSQQELERMGEIAKLAEAVAPTRPHPGVESPAANLIVGPFAAMLDRVRDVISSAR